MTLEEYRREKKESEEFLDKIDIEKYFKDYKDVSDIMNEIEDDYNKSCPSGCVFNVINTLEFIDYLTKRYPNYSFKEVTNYYVIKLD